MDLLSQRYASPFLIMDEFIRLQQFHDFVCETLNNIVEEKLHEQRWQFYLHRIYGITFEEFERQCKQPKQGEKQMTKEEIGNVIGESRKILEGFVPE